MSNYVVLDLEMCGVPPLRASEFKLKNELIQIGAVALNEELNITDEFMTHVCPQFGVIDAFIENLTGITPADVKDAPNFLDAMQNFLDWLPTDAVLVSWSNSDKKQIFNEAEEKNFIHPQLETYFETWIDCQQTFAEKMDTQKHYKLSEALVIADINYSDGEHDALIDAKNTAQLFIKMQREPNLVLSPYYTNQTDTPSYNPFAELLGKYDFSD